MCGRYTLTRDDVRFAERLRLADRPAFTPRYNIAPTQQAPVIRTEDRGPAMKVLRWGLIPRWAKNGMGPLINARAETVWEKPSFREAFKRQRCLVPADGFYEWLKLESGKQPVRIVMKGEEPFAMAGLWDRWTDSAGASVEGFTIVTTRANSLLEHVHDRMPVVLGKEDWAGWLDPEADPESLRSMLLPFPSERMHFYPVNRLVNDARRDEPACAQPLGGHADVRHEPNTLFLPL